MKPFHFMCGRKQEIDDEKEENVLLMEESEDEDFDSFQQETDAAKMEGVNYLESSMVDFSTNMFVMFDNIGDERKKAHYLYVCGIQEVVDCEYETTGLRTTNLSKSEFVSVVNE
ncbi:hypothetical protein AVEN_134099-1 [Araneus ventricosus]|uniref:Uncharacterized protein n=1 Tax=Araneus ventricosus TaxID=182803 RepID=A0A4Y2F4Z6_ARAVE|nr:hypothetical protein AVEN_134099-1 [Araneus ventricosus]